MNRTDGTTTPVEWPQPVPIRNVWPGEASDFTPWLAEEDNLAQLGEALGLGALALTGTEVTVPETNRSLDILAETPDGARIAVENQYGEADHDHFTRGLAYAVGLNAAALVVIAENHRSEFIAVADYLNDLVDRAGAENAFPIFLLNISAKQVGGIHFPAFDILARPNNWHLEVEQAAKRQESSREETLAQFPQEMRQALGKTVEVWESTATRSVRWGKQSFTLCARPSGQRPAFQKLSSGRVNVKPAALAEISPLDEAELVHLMETIFGSALEARSDGWFSLGAPSPDQVLAFPERACPDPKLVSE